MVIMVTKLSRKLDVLRADRPDEWSMDEFKRDAEALEQRIKELGQERVELLSVVYNHCVGDVAMGYRIDAESLGQDIYSITGLNAEQVHQLRKQAEDL